MALTLAEKQESMKNSAIGLIQKRVLKQAIVNLGADAMIGLGCLPHETSIHLRVLENSSELFDGIRLTVYNRKDTRRKLDKTEKALELRKQYPQMEKLLQGILDNMRELAEFWETDMQNMQFVFWLGFKDPNDQDPKKAILKAIVKPISGYDSKTYIKFAG